MIYCIDTSALIAARKESYPPDVFLNFWEQFEELITDGQLIAPDEVKNELAARDDELFSWAKQHADMFAAQTARLQHAMKESVLPLYNTSIPQLSLGKPWADPWVIALAKLNGAQVITQEGGGQNKIPTICAAHGMPCTNLVGLLRAEGWTF